MGVLAVYLFGSYAADRVHPLSDYDFGVVFEDPEKYKDKTMDVYSKLYDIIIEHLPKKYLRKRLEMRAHEFDIVLLQYAPIRLQFAAIKGKVLYESDTEKRLQYQEYIIKRHADMKYYYDLSFKHLLERI